MVMCTPQLGGMGLMASYLHSAKCSVMKARLLALRVGVGLRMRMFELAGVFHLEADSLQVPVGRLESDCFIQPKMMKMLITGTGIIRVIESRARVYSYLSFLRSSKELAL